MSELGRREFARPDARLSRRSLFAAAGILAAVSSGWAGKASAFARSKPTKIRWENDHKPGDPCHAKCVVCFLRGTRLQTPTGEVVIEGLRIGDLLVTKSGDVRPIRWIGRIVAERDNSGAWPEDAVPVRVARGAFGNGNPRRDLYLSRTHLIHLDGLLIPIGDLINGRTITPAKVDGERLEYFHVELETHDVVLAEGAPCDSLRLTSERLMSFDNRDEYLALYGAPSQEMTACAPVVAFNGRRSELRSRLRSAIAPMIDIRRPMDVVRDGLEGSAFRA